MRVSPLGTTCSLLEDQLCAELPWLLGTRSVATPLKSVEALCDCAIHCMCNLSQVPIICRSWRLRLTQCHYAMRSLYEEQLCTHHRAMAVSRAVSVKVFRVDGG